MSTLQRVVWCLKHLGRTDGVYYIAAELLETLPFMPDNGKEGGISGEHRQRAEVYVCHLAPDNPDGYVRSEHMVEAELIAGDGAAAGRRLQVLQGCAGAPEVPADMLEAINQLHSSFFYVSSGDLQALLEDDFEGRWIVGGKIVDLEAVSSSDEAASSSDAESSVYTEDSLEEDPLLVELLLR
ncbi:hypothetical protein OEZ86_002952 [Tetradesmus obliquus]|nr:hypothetical protein OEZ86_002952 [Tetradesmus obliquus]